MSVLEKKINYKRKIVSALILGIPLSLTIVSNSAAQTFYSSESSFGSALGGGSYFTLPVPYSPATPGFQMVSNPYLTGGVSYSTTGGGLILYNDGYFGSNVYYIAGSSSLTATLTTPQTAVAFILGNYAGNTGPFSVVVNGGTPQLVTLTTTTSSTGKKQFVGIISGGSLISQIDFSIASGNPEIDILYPDGGIQGIITGPSAANTQTMVYLNAFDVKAALTHRTMVIDQSLSYDCSIFDANNICVSWGGRYGNSGNSINDGAGVLTVAYRFLPEFYVGAFVDQSAPMDYGTSIRSTGMDPTFGGFLVWQENPDQSGFRVRLSAARHNGNVRITREASLSDTEAGTGKTGLHSWGYGADISYGFNVDEGVLLSPYAGIRRSTARRQGYTEETSDDVEYPLSYRHMDRELTTATSGIRGMMRIEHGIRLLASAGMEYDVSTSQDAMTGTSSITDFENFSLSSSTRKANRTRGAGSIGAQFPITSNAAFVVNTSLRQQAYTSDLSLGVMASVMVGF